DDDGRAAGTAPARLGPRSGPGAPARLGVRLGAPAGGGPRAGDRRRPARGGRRGPDAVLQRHRDGGRAVDRAQPLDHPHVPPAGDRRRGDRPGRRPRVPGLGGVARARRRHAPSPRRHRGAVPRPLPRDAGATGRRGPRLAGRPVPRVPL
ncbi:MAG: hypothetical protein AVDCRST_MAG52-2846, partial [uncultured Blastococcus sp.]